MSTNTAFTILLSELDLVIRENEQRYDQAMQVNRAEIAELAAGQRENLDSMRQQLEILQDLWPKLVGRPVPLALPVSEEGPPIQPIEVARSCLSPAKTLPRGYQTPEREFWLPILTALEEMGGHGPAAQVLHRVEQLMSGRLNELDHSLLDSGEPRWRTAAHWARLSMKKQGFIARNSPRGCWEITDQGRAFLHSEQTKQDMKSQLQLGFF